MEKSIKEQAAAATGQIANESTAGTEELQSRIRALEAENKALKTSES